MQIWLQMYSCVEHFIMLLKVCSYVLKLQSYQNAQAELVEELHKLFKKIWFDVHFMICTT